MQCLQGILCWYVRANINLVKMEITIGPSARMQSF